MRLGRGSHIFGAGSQSVCMILRWSEAVYRAKSLGLSETEAVLRLSCMKVLI